MTTKKTQQLAAMLKEAHHVAVLTGAGVSTESGIPDFRTPESGLWAQMDPLEVFSRRVLYSDPEMFWQRAEPLFSRLLEAEPNPCHRGLSRLEEAGFIGRIITQNIDSLHQQAGSKRVMEVHGHLRSGSCMTCGSTQPLEQLLETVRRGNGAPGCKCGGIMRPDVVLFEDPLPEVFEEAWRLVTASDLLLVVGSSLEVAPVCWLAERARQLAIVNMSSTGYDYRASLIIRGKAGHVISDLAKHLGAW